MDQRDFNRQMDSYLRGRKPEGGGLFDDLKRKLPRIKVTASEPETTVSPESVPKDAVDAVLRGESVSPSVMDEVEQEIESGVEDSSTQFRSFWDRWFGWILGSDASIDDVEVEVEPSKDAVDADVKEMLRICVHWINSLPPEKIQDIKRSDDFRTFKDLLDKYGLLKKK